MFSTVLPYKGLKSTRVIYRIGEKITCEGRFTLPSHTTNAENLCNGLPQSTKALMSAYEDIRFWPIGQTNFDLINGFLNSIRYSDYLRRHFRKLLLIYLFYTLKFCF